MATSVLGVFEVVSDGSYGGCFSVGKAVEHSTYYVEYSQNEVAPRDTYSSPRQPGGSWQARAAAAEARAAAAEARAAAAEARVAEVEADYELVRGPGAGVCSVGGRRYPSEALRSVVYRPAFGRALASSVH